MLFSSAVCPYPLTFGFAGPAAKEHLLVHYMLVSLVEMLKSNTSDLHDLSRLDELRKRIEGQGF